MIMVALKQLNQLIPNPDADIFRRRHRQNIIQAGVVQMCQHLFLHQILQLDKINNHTLVVGSALYLYHQLIGMTVQLLALARSYL